MDDEQVVIKITSMDERMAGMQKDIKVLFKRMDDRDAGAATFHSFRSGGFLVFVLDLFEGLKLMVGVRTRF